MARIPKKVAVIGFDCALPHLIERLIEEGVLAENGLARQDRQPWDKHDCA